jgi:hypothetical protein
MLVASPQSDDACIENIDAPAWFPLYEQRMTRLIDAHPAESVTAPENTSITIRRGRSICSTELMDDRHCEAPLWPHTMC